MQKQDAEASCFYVDIFDILNITNIIDIDYIALYRFYQFVEAVAWQVIVLPRVSVKVYV